MEMYITFCDDTQFNGVPFQGLNNFYKQNYLKRSARYTNAQ